MQNRNDLTLELIEYSGNSGRNTSSSGMTKGNLEILSSSVEAPNWYDSTGDIAAWETLSLCAGE